MVYETNRIEPEGTLLYQGAPLLIHFIDCGDKRIPRRAIRSRTSASNYEQGLLEQRVQADTGVLVFLLQSNHIWLHCVRALEKIKRFQRINEDSPLGGAIHTGRFPAPGLEDTSKYPSDLVKPYYSQSYRSHAV